jgi:hypothetical protein
VSAGASSEGVLTEAEVTENGHPTGESGEGDLESGATPRTRTRSGLSNPPSTLAAYIGGGRRRAANGEATVTKVGHVPHSVMFFFIDICAWGSSTLTGRVKSSPEEMGCTR